MNKSEKRLTPIKAIRNKCLECSNRQPSEVKNCTIIDCSLFIYRLGKNPSRKGIKKGFYKIPIESKRLKYSNP